MDRLHISLGGPSSCSTDLNFHYHGRGYDAPMSRLEKLIHSAGTDSMICCHQFQPSERHEKHPIGVLKLLLTLFDGNDLNPLNPMFAVIDRPVRMTRRDALEYGIISGSGVVSGSRFNEPFPMLPVGLANYLSVQRHGFRAFGIRTVDRWIRIVFSDSGIGLSAWFAMFHRACESVARVKPWLADAAPWKTTMIHEIGSTKWFGLSLIAFEHPTPMDGHLYYPVGLRTPSIEELKKGSDWLWKSDERQAILATGRRTPLVRTGS